MIIRYIRIGLCSLFALTALSVHAQTSLQDGDRFLVNLDETTGSTAVVFSNIFIDVPADATALMIRFTDQGNGRQLAIYGRVGSDFPDTSSLTALSQDASFFSISDTGDEILLAQNFAEPSPSGQRMHLFLIGFAGPQIDALLEVDVDFDPPPRAQILVDFDNSDNNPNCDIGPWDSTEPHTPIGGNNATTLGQARRNAMLHAADLLSNELTSRVPIRIKACWFDGGDDGGGITLASAGPNGFVNSTPGRNYPEFAYPVPASKRLAGNELCHLGFNEDCDVHDLRIQYNFRVDERSTGFYYGFDGSIIPTGSSDFISTALHELGHGLGFLTAANEDGSLFSLGPDIFLKYLVEQDGGIFTNLSDPSVTNAQRAAAFINPNDLLWDGDEANHSEENTLYRGFSSQGRVSMFSPGVYNPGSSVSHISTDYCDLMGPFIRPCTNGSLRSLQLTRHMLNNVGWHSAPNTPPYIGFEFDSERNGHGYEFQLAATTAEGVDIYVMTFFTYASNGLPEWHQAIGTIIDGTFVGTRNSDGLSFPRYTYDEMLSPPQVATPNIRGQVVVSFNDLQSSDACSGRSGSFNGSFQWVIGNDVAEWCVEPLVALSSIPENDFGGLWFAGTADQGWGMSIENFTDGDGSTNLFIVLYVYDANGDPVWFFALADGFIPGQPFTADLFQRTGFGRTQTPTALQDVVAGTITLTFVTPSSDLGAGNTVDNLQVDFLGPAGGGWSRQNAPIQRLSQPRP